MQKLIQLELNEVNFDFVRAYGEKGQLPRLNQLIARHGLTETTSESRYEHLEPWIQWVSAHTGLSYAEHQVFRLGDILARPELPQIWELLEQAGYDVGAISPMNARNACADPAFFVPDPWTAGKVTGPPLLRRLYGAISQIVNDNAQGRIEKASLAWLGAGLVRFARPANYAVYAALAGKARKKAWARALLLDLLLADLFIAANRRSGADFATLFLNAAAHIQHHYMYNSAVYRGPHRNPGWYIDAEADPLLEVYQLYDRIVGQVIDTFPEHRILVATGLHQDPYPDLLFYWRLRDHAGFLSELGVPYARVEPRMSRDFMVWCNDTEQAAEAERTLAGATASDGRLLFDVDNRGDSLFVMLSYPAEVTPELGYRVGNRHFTGLADKTAFVAIKNGEHNGTGYLIDTAAHAGHHPANMPLTELSEIARRHFDLKPRKTNLAA